MLEAEIRSEFPIVMAVKLKREGNKQERSKKKVEQGRIHGNFSRGRLGRGGNELGRGSKGGSHTKSKCVTN